MFSGCASAPAPEVPKVDVDPSLRQYFLDPALHCIGSSAGSSSVHHQLLRDGDAVRAEAAATSLLAAEAADDGARAVLAQSRAAAGRFRESAELTDLSAARLAGCPALAAVRGISLERLGDIAGAYAAYRQAGDAAATVSRRASELSSDANAAGRAEFVAAMERGHLEAAGWYLDRLELWWPRSEATLRSRIELAQRSGDSARELVAVRALQQARGDDSQLALRRGLLEIEVGDARTGLALIEALAKAEPGNVELAAALDRARFEWRLQNSPEAVRRLSRAPEMQRGDFATLIYWMTPPVRTARVAGGRIASDILDHPQREAIAKVVNLGLMNVDESVHRFSPAASLRRGEALRALVRLDLFLAGEPGRTAAGAPGRDSVCEAAAAAALIESVEACAPNSGLSGREAVELLRITLSVGGAG